MSKKYVLVIAEKPSVAQSIAKVVGAYQRKDGYLEGGGYLVSWCVGHLIGLASADQYDIAYRSWAYETLPIFPQEWKYEINEDRKRQFDLLKKLMNRTDVAEVVEATDAGREGELIFRLVYQMAKCRKPVRRLWISSLEEDAIKEGLLKAKDIKAYDTVYEAASCRMQADWLVGINATRLFTSLHKKLLTIGRVQTPTLAMIVERSDQIACFHPETYFMVELVAENGMCMKSSRLKQRQEAEKLAESCEGKTAEVMSIQRSDETVACPHLYDLTSLQRESNRVYGYTAQQTLTFAQSLYEKKLITYPRTDNCYLTEDMQETVQTVWKQAVCFCGLQEGELPKPNVTPLIGEKVSDHHAILPTKQLEQYKATALTEEEKKILYLISLRLICATMQPYRYLKTKICLSCAGESFEAKGVQTLVSGWKKIWKQQIREDNTEQQEFCYELQEGHKLLVTNATVTDHKTSPPKSFTEDLLLAEMERAGYQDFDKETEKKGIGTPATRAAIIEKLIRQKYVERKGKQLLATKEGTNLIAVVPETLKSAKRTAAWENRLLAIERGAETRENFLKDIQSELKDLVRTYAFLADGERKNQ